MKQAVIAILASLIPAALAVKGVDFQGLATKDNFDCIFKGDENKGGQFVVFRAWQGNNTFNPTTNQNIDLAVASQLNSSQIMLYVSPCYGPSKLDGKQQIKDLFTSLGVNRTKTFNRVWINVETNPY